MMKIVTAFLIVALFAGCSSTPHQTFVEADAPDDNHGLIYIYRSTLDSNESESTPALRLDGKPIGRLKRDSYLLVMVEPGKHALTVKSKGFGKDLPDVFASTTVDIKGGQTLYLRYSESVADMVYVGSSIYARTEAEFYAVPAATARNEMAKARLSKL